MRTYINKMVLTFYNIQQVMQGGMYLVCEFALTTLVVEGTYLGYDILSNI